MPARYPFTERWCWVDTNDGQTLHDRYNAKKKQLQEVKADLELYQLGKKIAITTENELNALRAKMSRVSEQNRVLPQPTTPDPLTAVGHPFSPSKGY